MSRKSPETPSWYPTVQGDLLSRVNLFRWIREWARAHEIDDFDYFEFGVLNGESVVEAIRQLRGGGASACHRVRHLCRDPRTSRDRRAIASAGTLIRPRAVCRNVHRGCPQQHSGRN